MATAVVSLGSNLGDRAAMLDQAVTELRRSPGISILAVSSYHDTQPIGGPAGQGSFLNAALKIETSLPPAELLRLLLAIETRLGRQRGERWSARTIDLDLLLHDVAVLETNELVLPHPRMAFRRFVLEPAAEVAPDMLDPRSGWTIRQLLMHLDTASNYIAIGGVDRSAMTALATSVAVATGCQLLSQPTGSDVSGGRVGDAAIEFVASAAAVLAAVGASESVPGWISDFSYEQLLVGARQSLTGPALAAFEVKWKEFSVARPKLLVLLRSEAQSNVDAEVQEKLAEHAAQPDQVPFLTLDAADPELATDETVAAFLAMQ